MTEHAFLTYTGNRWRCERGYSVSWSSAEAHVPEQAFLNSRGDGWECERGFRRSGDRCAPE